MLSTKYYNNQESYDLEVSVIKNSVPIFLCVEDDVANSGDYISLDMFGESVIVQNNQGSYKCFKNVCMHKFTRLVSAKRGNGKLTCPYHGWTYDGSGSLYGCPAKKTFDCDLSHVSLVEFSTYKVGKFIFAFLGDGKFDFFTYFSPISERLLTLSEGFAESLSSECTTFSSNWKIAVENTLESYHVFKVHPTSLHSMKILDEEMTYRERHSSSIMKFKATESKSIKKINRLLVDRAVKIEDYEHFFVFPNLTLASAYGFTLSVQGFYPQAFDETSFSTTIYQPIIRGEGKGCSNEILKNFTLNAFEFNRIVFSEDKAVCEEAQKGMNLCADEKMKYLSSIEDRVFHFQKSIMALHKKSIEQGDKVGV